VAHVGACMMLKTARRMGGVERLLPNGAAYGHALTMSETSER